jgi:site-specific recombinase XerD
MKLYLPLAVEEFIEHKRSTGKKELTINHLKLCFSKLGDFLQDQNIEDLRNVSKEIARELIPFAKNLKREDGKPLSESYWHKVVNATKELYRFLYQRQKILSNPFEHLELPKKSKRIPKDILSEDEIQLLLESMQKKYGLFGLAVGELLYGTGIRLSECIMLKKDHVNLQEGVVYIKEGKGDKDRMVPIPKTTLNLLKQYLTTHKPDQYFFEKFKGKHLSKTWVEVAIKEAIKNSTISKHVTPHVIRHTFATHLLQHGMDIRYIQELLGHEQVTTTEIYTKVEPKDLKQVHRNCHPRK